jgi:hypothetical protein
MAMTKTKRRKRSMKVATGMPATEFLRLRVTTPDTRSHTEFLQAMREKQAAGRLANPATAALLDRLETVI